MLTQFARSAAVAALVLSGSELGHTAAINGIQAIVHDSVITQQEVQQMTGRALQELRLQYPNEDATIIAKLASAERDNLEELMERQLILHEYKTAGYNIPESVIDDIVQEQIRSRYGDRRTLTKSLQQEGTTYERFRERAREKFIVEAMRNKFISSEIIISPQKVENYYATNKEQFKAEEEMKVRMIVLNKTGDGSGIQPRRLAEDLVVKLQEGTPFTELAAVYSQRSQRGGSDGEWFQKDQIRKELAEAVHPLKPGQTSGVVETPEACYLLQLVEVRPEHYKPLTEVRTTIEANLLQEERTRIEKQWVDRLRKKTFVRYY
jgi:parvulin-like peptidyl-prolyl isomerase